ncbi:MAG: hypothetical protein WCL57_00655 [Chloroflexota bacterium]
MLNHFSPGNYRFVPGHATFSSGTVADDGYQIVRATFRHMLPVADGFVAMQQHLQNVGRSTQAVCGLELRSPKPFTPPDFAVFNAGYVKLLAQYGLHLGDLAPAARSNLAPVLPTHTPNVPSMYGFSYTLPGKTTCPNFIVAGVGDLRSGGVGPEFSIRYGETTPDAIREKSLFVMNGVGKMIAAMEASWADVTGCNYYATHAMDEALHRELLVPMGAAGALGMTWFYVKPPVTIMELEIDARSVSAEIVI